MVTALSSYVSANPKSIDSSLHRLTCTSQGICDIDVHPSILSVLTLHAPHEVKQAVAAALSPHSSDAVDAISDSEKRYLAECSRQSARKREKCGSFNVCAFEKRTTRSCGGGLNIALAFALHTVLLSRNRITHLLGIVQFRHVQRLSLLGNGIRRIEDCQPLALLPQLAYLSLEFNPVTTLPHYRAHILCICAWPNPLSQKHCRLRKLDGNTVTTAEVEAAVGCLQREMAMLPELFNRLRLIAFLVNVESRLALHNEMRMRGFLFKDTEKCITVDRILHLGSGAVLESVDGSQAAHMTRKLVGEKMKEFFPQNSRASSLPCQSGCVSSCVQKEEYDDHKKMESLPLAKNICDDTLSTYITDSLSADLSTEESGATEMLNNVSGILLGEQSWSRLSLRNAEKSLMNFTCDKWSADLFRRTISFMDVRLCTMLLRVARVLGQPMDANTVDRLCRGWLQLVTQHSDMGPTAVNATGSRRRSSPPRVHTSSSRFTRLAAAEEQQLDEFGNISAVSEGPHSVTSTTGADALLLGELAGRLQPFPLQNVAPGCAGPQQAILQEETQSFHSTLSEIQPRSGLPVAAQAVSRPKSTVPHMAPVADGSSRPPSLSTTLDHRDHQHEIRLEQQLVLMRRRRTLRLLQHWRTALLHRRQWHQCELYIKERARRMLHRRVTCPFDTSLLSQLSYTARKRVFFVEWWQQTVEAREAQAFYLRQRLRMWRKCTLDVQGIRLSHLRGGHAHKRRTFSIWKTRASAHVAQRVTDARQRLIAFGRAESEPIAAKILQASHEGSVEKKLSPPHTGYMYTREVILGSRELSPHNTHHSSDETVGHSDRYTSSGAHSPHIGSRHKGTAETEGEWSYQDLHTSLAEKKKLTPPPPLTQLTRVANPSEQAHTEEAGDKHMGTASTFLRYVVSSGSSRYETQESEALRTPDPFPSLRANRVVSPWDVTPMPTPLDRRLNVCTQTELHSMTDTSSDRMQASELNTLRAMVEHLTRERGRLVQQLIDARFDQEADRMASERKDERISVLEKEVKMMNIREGCALAAQKQYEAEIQRLKHVVDALRDERRDTLLRGVCAGGIQTCCGECLSKCQ